MKAQTKSFTLVEVILACTVLVVVLLGFGQAIITAQKQTTALEQEFTILTGCEEVMDRLSKLPFETLRKQDGASFALKLSPESIQELSGKVIVSEDLNGNGKIERDAPYYEGNGDAVCVSLLFRDKLILRRIICKYPTGVIGQ